MKSMSKLLASSAFASTLLLSSAYAADAFKIRVADSFSGAKTIFREQVFNGMSAYVEDVNAADDFNAKKAELVRGDITCEPKQAIASRSIIA